MAILDRVSTLIRANLNDLLDRAEDPEKVIQQLLRDMQNQLIQVKTQVAAAIADEKRLYQRYQESDEKANEWQRKAELAVDKGDDELAKAALGRRKSYAESASGFLTQYNEQHTQVESLKTALRQLEQKIDEAEARKDLLIARSRRAKAETKIRETLSGIGQTSAVSEFERLEDRVSRTEARAKAMAELESDTLESRFQALETDDDVDRELRELKARKTPSLNPPENTNP
ncbi:MAG: PspA/IM30 family protein [Chloroflexi bacterium]|nr:PspA/IM30 family protein [Chloroflexota bacterium]